MSEAEIGHLQDHAGDLGHGDDGDQRQQQPLAGHQGDRRQRRAQGQRSDVAHEHLRRVRVVPQEAETRADHDEAELHQERLALQLGDHAVGRERTGSDQAGKPIQPVGNVHRVAEAHDDHHGDRNPDPDWKLDEAGHQRDIHAIRILEPATDKRHHPSSDDRQDDLAGELGPGANALAALAQAADAFPIVDGAQNAEANEHEQRQQDARAGQAFLDQAGEIQTERDEHHRHEDQNAAHGGRAGLDHVRLRACLADLLADAQPPQNFDEGAAPDGRQQKGDRAQRESKRDFGRHRSLTAPCTPARLARCAGPL